MTWLQEKVSVRQTWRKRTIAQFLSLQAGDNLIVYEWSHLGKSTRECAEILAQALSQQVCVYAVQSEWQMDEPKQFATIIETLATIQQVDFDLRSRLTKQALAAKRKAGIKLGRPRGTGKSKLDKYRAEIKTLLANGSTQKFIAKRYGTTETNLSRWMKRQGLKRWQE